MFITFTEGKTIEFTGDYEVEKIDGFLFKLEYLPTERSRKYRTEYFFDNHIKQTNIQEILDMIDNPIKIENVNQYKCHICGKTRMFIDWLNSIICEKCIDKFN